MLDVIWARCRVLGCHVLSDGFDSVVCVKVAGHTDEIGTAKSSIVNVSKLIKQAQR